MFSDIPSVLKKRPEIYTPGTDVMWTDPYISQRLLEIHLDRNIDLASRKDESINSAIDWILSDSGTGVLDILDLGCGPGLYAERLSRKGHRVCGVDFSRVSIEYARSRAAAEGLGIEYLQDDYLQLDFPENSFDLIMMIYTDFGVLLPDQRLKLLSRIGRWLKPGGKFVFDVLNDNNWLQKASPNDWEIAEGGFWSEEEVLRLSDSFVYEPEGVILYRHTVLNRSEEARLYHFWTKYFSDSDLAEILDAAGFDCLGINRNVLPPTDAFSGANVSFVSACPAGGRGTD